VYLWLEHRPDAEYAREIGADELAIFVGVVLLYVDLEAILRWRAVVVVFLPVLIAIPARVYLGRWLEGPLWGVDARGGVLAGVPLAALRVGIRAKADRRIRGR
jgi:hypothetical protein